MNDEERIIQIGVENVRTPITWFEDPTRHLLKIKAVNAMDTGDAIARPSKLDVPPQDEANSPSPAD